MPERRRYRLLQGGVVLALAGSLLLLAPACAPRRSAETAATPPAAAGGAAGTEEEWLLVTLGGLPLGYTRSAVVALPGGGRLVRGEGVLRLGDGEEGLSAMLSEEALFGPDGLLRGFTYRQSAGRATLEVSGRAVPGGLELTHRPGGDPPRTMLLPEIPPPVPLLSLEEHLRRLPLREGDRHSLRALAEETGDVVPVEVSVGPREEVAVGEGTAEGRRITLSIAGAVSDVWMDGSGGVIRERAPGGLESVRVSREEALAASAEAPVGIWRLLLETGVPIDRPPEDTARLTRAVYLLEGLPAGFEIPGDGSQRVEGIEEYADEEGLPCRRALVSVHAGQPPGKAPAAGDEDRWTADHHQLRIDDPRIREPAEMLAGEGGSRLERARRVGEWVNRWLEKDFADGFSAPQVLESGRGECQAHALLTTALLRAAGIPARPVAGLVWDGGHGLFLYHAWVEVLDGGRWHPMDPALGLPAASAVHIKLLNDGLQGSWSLMGVFNRITLSLREMGYR